MRKHPILQMVVIGLIALDFIATVITIAVGAEFLKR